ncbi:hypothetical protein JZ751_028263 [Albula glossodonta]|uniref:Tubulin polymerization promoting protein n=1 Tax=Albula glossodonta TaxID=121402 RepID=A0A8T2NBM2_9TELE|nr:hypothetical protein JZ751_028263 [Albula glossodonta]
MTLPGSFVCDVSSEMAEFKVQMAKHPPLQAPAPASSPNSRPPSDHSKDRALKRLSSESNGTSEGGAGAATPVELTALEESFRRFAIHGDTRATGKELHGKNWSKLCKDCGVIDGKTITLTDVDIVFSKVKREIYSRDKPAVLIFGLPAGSMGISLLTLRSEGQSVRNEALSGSTPRDRPNKTDEVSRSQTREIYVPLTKKSCRTITYDQFREALGELARKRFKEKTAEEAAEEVFKMVEGKSPVISGVTRAVASPTVSRLTDTTKFTGSHKERFDETGKGKGKAGRVELVDTSGYVSGYKHAGSYEKKVKPKQI